MSQTPEASREADRREGCAHPRDTFELLGHERAERTVSAAMRGGRLHHAWLITGAAGVGKATFAYRMIRKLLGGRSLLPDGLDISANDPVSQRISAGAHGNLLVVRRPFDARSKRLKTEIPVASIRALSEFFQETAAEEGRPRIGLIDKADELNASSENAVLKLLEEPPNGAVLILLADHPGRLLPTIRSRCVQLHLRGVPETALRPWLGSQHGIGGELLGEVLWLSDGAPGQAVSWAADAEARRAVAQFADALATGRAPSPALSASLAGPKSADSLALFWSGARKLLVEAERGAWDAPYPEPRSGRAWSSVWRDALERERMIAELNTNTRVALMEFFAKAAA